MTNYFLAPTPRWQGRDKTGQPAINGYVYTWENLTRIPKATASDATGINLNSNPVSLDGKGEANIYWNDDNLYSIALYSSDGQLIETQDNYPISEGNGGGSVTVTTLEDNFVRNPQFNFCANQSPFTNYSTTTDPYSDFLADDWFLLRDTFAPEINISVLPFAAGQTEVPFTPLSYLEYECTQVNSGTETIKYLGQAYAGANSLNNSELSFAFWAKSDTLSDFSVSIQQFFGTGGSPSSAVTTPIISSTALTSGWVQYTGTVVLPSISGKTLGTKGDDSVILQINLPLNAIAIIDIANIQLQQRAAPSAFPYLTPDEQLKRLNTVQYAIYQTGDIKMSMRSLMGTPQVIELNLGWLLLTDDGVSFKTIGNPNSGATSAGWRTKGLFFVLWEDWSETYLPIYTSSGVATTRGASAEDDWEANKRMALPLTGGRPIANCSAFGNVPGFYQGTATVSLTEDQNGPHDHDYDAWDGGYSGTGRGDGNDTLPNAPNSHTTTQSGTGAPHNNIPPTVYMYFYIKL